VNDFIPPLVASDEMLKEVNEIMSKLLPIPEGAFVKGERFLPGGVLNPKFTANWDEALEIQGSLIKEDTKVPGRYIVNLRTRPLRMDALNKTFWMSYYLDPNQLKYAGKAPVKGDPSYGAWKMTQMSCAKLNDLLRALGVDAHGMSVNYVEYFHSENGSEPAVVGKKVVARIRHKIDEQGTERQEADAGPGRPVFSKFEGPEI
jgi:hypothetical protein